MTEIMKHHRLVHKYNLNDFKVCCVVLSDMLIHFKWLQTLLCGVVLYLGTPLCHLLKFFAKYQLQK